MNQHIKTSLGVIIIVIIIITVWMFIGIYEKDKLTGEPEISQSFQENFKIGHKACTMEAKICPDGSTVSRTGPKCEFAMCPTSKTSENSVTEK